MSGFTRMSAKGQVVIPKQVRDHKQWRSGTELEVVERADGVLLKPLLPHERRLSLAQFRRHVPPHEGKPLSIEEMDAAVVRQFESEQK